MSIEPTDPLSLAETVGRDMATVDASQESKEKFEQARKQDLLDATIRDLRSSPETSGIAGHLLDIGPGANIDVIVANAQAKARLQLEQDDADNQVQYYVAEEEAQNAAREAADDYLRNTRYSAESQRYIRDQFAIIMENSPEMQQLKHDVDALPPAERAAAEKELHDNAAKYETMRTDPRYAEHKAEMEEAAKLGLINSEKGKQWLEMIENGESPEKIHALKEEMFKTRIERAGQVIDSLHHGQKPDGQPTVSTEEQAIIEAKYTGPDGKLDHRKMLEDWAKLRETKEADAAFKAYEDSGHDLSKLPKDQQAVIALSKEMLAVDMAAPWQAVIEISQRNNALMASKGVGDELATQLNDQTLSVAERSTILKNYMDREGMQYTESGVKNAIEAIDYDASHGKHLAKGEYKASGTDFVQAYRDDYTTLAPAASGYDIVNAEFNKQLMSFDELRKSEKIAAPDLYASPPRAVTAPNASPAMPAQEAALTPAVAAETSMQTTAPAIVAGTAFSPPPGMDIAQLAALGNVLLSQGVNGGYSSANTGASTVQSAKAPSRDAAAMVG